VLEMFRASARLSPTGCAWSFRNTVSPHLPDHARVKGLSMFHSASISRLLVALGLSLSAALVAPSPALAQDSRQNAPGEFDFYVLSLSWSPSFCEEAEERGSSGRAQAQCSGRPFSFVVHGLWPQYERGFPEYCQRPSPRLARNIMTSMLDLMP